MKKLLFLAIGLLTIAASVNAQDGPRRYPRRVVRRLPPQQQSHRYRPVDDWYKPKVGIAGGLNISNTVDAYNADFSTSSVAGAHIGLTFELPIVYPLSFAPEFLFSQKGYKAETPDGTFRQRTNFIDIPLLAKLRVTKGFNIVVGPQLTFQTSTRNTYDDGFSTIYRDNYDGLRDKSYLSGLIGVGFDLNRNAELRFRYALDFNQNRGDANSSIPDYRNQVFQIGLGFKFQ